MQDPQRLVAAMLKLQSISNMSHDWPISLLPGLLMTLVLTWQGVPPPIQLLYLHLMRQLAALKLVSSRICPKHAGCLLVRTDPSHLTSSGCTSSCCPFAPESPDKSSQKPSCDWAVIYTLRSCFLPPSNLYCDISLVLLYAQSLHSSCTFLSESTSFLLNEL